MSLQTDLITALATVADGRVYAQMAPERVDFPFVVYRRAARTPEATIHGGAPAAIRSDIVFECYGKTYQEALTTAQAVRSALYATTLPWFETSGSGDEYEPAVDVFMEPVYAGFWETT